ncbi:MAG: hypothetical protein GDA41_01840 [Rhodospirillales bacterium]|nr:hypothetical protein [Rhodospirillales bacterium]
MSETVTNALLLENLKALRGEIRSVSERLGRVENRLAAVEGHLAVLVQRDLEHNVEADALARRVERIERRLDLVEPPAS